MLSEESYYLRENREGRIVDHDVARVVIPRVRIVSAGPEDPDEVRLVYVVFLSHPVRDGVVDVLRGVAVVGRQLRLELIDEARVVLEGLPLL